MRKSEPLIDAVEASSILGVSRSQVNRRAANGELPIAAKAPGIRGAYLFRRSDIERIAERAA